MVMMKMDDRQTDDGIFVKSQPNSAYTGLAMCVVSDASHQT